MFVWVFTAMLFATTAHASDVRYMANGELALSQLYLELEGAKKSVDISQYYFDPCQSVGKLVIKMLTEKKPPIKVRILLDGLDRRKKSRRQMTDYLAKYGIEIRFFNPNVTGKPLQNNPILDFRTHSKMIAVDEEQVTVGGRNFCDDYYGIAEKQNWVDRDLWATGKPVADAKKSFDRLWEHKLSQTETVRATPEDMEEFEKKCIAFNERDTALEKFLHDNAKKIVDQAQTHQCDDVSLAMDDMSHSGNSFTVVKENALYTVMPGRKKIPKDSTKSVVDFYQSAKSSLSVENYMYVPSHQFDLTLEGKRKDNVKVDVVTNAHLEGIVETEHQERLESDEKHRQTFYPLQKMGGLSQRWEFTPSSATFELHTKVAVADDKDVMVGSFNIDPRSYHTNGEVNMVVKNCPSLAKEVSDETKKLENIFEEDSKMGIACFEGPQEKIDYKEYFRRKALRQLL